MRDPCEPGRMWTDDGKIFGALIPLPNRGNEAKEVGGLKMRGSADACENRWQVSDQREWNEHQILRTMSRQLMRIRILRSVRSSGGEM